MAQIARSQAAIAIAAFIGMTVSSPAVLSVNGLLLTSITAEFGWGRATISTAYLVAAPIMAALYLVVGPVLDRFGARRLLLVGYLLFGASMALLSQLNGSVAQLLLLKALATSCATLPTGVAFGKVVSRHFTTHRGKMLGLCLGAGGGLGMTVMPLIGAQLLAGFGWRGTYVGVGIIAILIGIPAALSLPADGPQAIAKAATPVASGVDARSALRDPSYIILLVTTLLACMVLNGTLAHIAAIMTDNGLTATEGALALSTYAAAMMAAQFGIGFLLDRIPSPRLALPVFLVVLAGVALLHVGHGSRFTLLLGAALVGAGAGSEYGLLPYMLTRFFGLRAFGTLYALIYSTSAIGTGIGPYAMGLAYDWAGSYSRALFLFEAAIVVIVLLLWRLPRYVFAADGRRMGDPHRANSSQAPPDAVPINAA
jgi:MFS family permease